MQSHPSSHTIRDFSRYGTDKRLVPAYLVLGYVCIIVYGSLLPFTLKELAFDAAWSNFQHIPLLKLGVANRADLVANLLLYIPLGFLTCGFLVGNGRHLLGVVAGMAVSLLFSAAVALGVEFTQQFFPPRTVSLNDLYAELVGAALGTVLWPLIGKRAVRLVRMVLLGGGQARQAVLLTYALAYGVLSVFPYDFLLSSDEWQRKWASDQIGWLFAPLCGSGCVWKLIPEILAVMPLAVLLFRSMSHVPLVLAAVTGAMLGMLIEGLQLAIASGVSQGVSIISRAIGMVLGACVLRAAPQIDWRWIRQHSRGILMIGLIPYLAALAWVSHWFSGNWLSVSDGITRLDEVRFIPFYYHYYTTERIALISLLFQAGIYAPVGIFFWSWRWAVSPTGPARSNVWLPGITATFLAGVIEAGKLFVPRTHPDPTDILIAAVSAIAMYRLLEMLFMMESRGGEETMANATEEKQITRRIKGASPLDAAETAHQIDGDVPHNALKEAWQHQKARHPSGLKLAGGLALGVAIITAITHPFGMQWVLPPLLIYIALLWWRPGWWLVWVLAFLPILDLTPWSGRLFWNEFDTLLLATLGVGYLRLCPVRSGQPALGWPAGTLLAMFALSALISLVIGMLPVGALDLNAFASYYSPYNGLRLAKGLLLALAFIPLLAREWNEPACAARRLTWGMVLGLTAEVLYVLWERITFSGLFNFETDYRITGSFHGMHVGGAYIESYLAAVLPFVVLWAWQQRNLWAIMLATALYGLGAYSIMVTFSRGGQIAFMLVTLITLLGFIRLLLQGKTRQWVGISGISLLMMVAVVVAWPVMSGKYSQSRWEGMERDIAKRTDHWAEVLNIFHAREAFAFGIGLGSFPAAYYWDASVSSRPATYRFITENDNIFLQLGSGNLLYFEQSVGVEPAQRYTLTLDLRSHDHNAALAVAVCEKSIIYSYTCSVTPLRLNEATGEWVHFKTLIETRDFGPPGTQFQRPVKLSLFNNRAGTLVDVDNVALYDAAGQNLMRNGDFSSGMQNWFFSVDNYWPWHIENLFLNILFEQGGFGFICMLILIVYALIRWLIRAWQHEPFCLTMCASFAGLLFLGILNSWNDEPRLAFLFYFLLIAGLMADKRYTAKTG